MIDRVKLGKRIRTLRGEMPLDKVAKDLGISLSALKMYETGQRVPRDEIKIRIANYFGESIEDIFFAQ
ncbi:MAG: helix-turn-helix transcriptional regulator [Oscillospiraceae bacterium]